MAGVKAGLGHADEEVETRRRGGALARAERASAGGDPGLQPALRRHIHCQSDRERERERERETAGDAASAAAEPRLGRPADDGGLCPLARE